MKLKHEGKQREEASTLAIIFFQVFPCWRLSSLFFFLSRVGVGGTTTIFKRSRLESHVSRSAHVKKARETLELKREIQVGIINLRMQYTQIGWCLLTNHIIKYVG